MKKLFANILIAATAFSGLGLSSCADDLDMTPDGRMDMDQVFGDPDNVKYYFAQAWMYIYRHDWANYFFENYFIDMADEGWSTDDGQAIIINDLYKGNVTTEKHRFEWDDRTQGRWDGNYWKRDWESIRVLNMFLSRIGTANCESEAERRLLEAEAHVLRAYYYTHMVKLYGDVPIITKPSDINTSYAETVREPAWKVFQFVVDECEAALACDELPWRITDMSNRNRMTKGIACAIMSQASLFAASPLYCYDEDLWSWAEKVNERAFKLLTEQGGFELYTQLQNPKAYLNAYQEYFALDSYAGNIETDKETIWGASDKHRAEGLYIVNGIPVNEGLFKVGICPTQNLIDAYDMKATGKPIYNLEQPYKPKEGGTGPNDWDITKPNLDPSSGYKESDPYAGRDDRFYANTFYNGCKFTPVKIPKTVATWNNSNENYWGTKDGKKGVDAIDPGSRLQTRTGYYNRKYHQYMENKDSKYGGGSWKFYRLGEVYLNYAEAAIESGNIGKGLELINEIRHRAGFSPTVDVKASTKDYARLLVRHERQVELCFEEHRYYDCRRWGKPGEDIMEEKYKGGMWIISTDSKTASSAKSEFHRFVIDTYHFEDGSSQACYQAKYRLVPIPLKEQQNMESKTGSTNWQNPGW